MHSLRALLDRPSGNTMSSPPWNSNFASGCVDLSVQCNCGDAPAVTLQTKRRLWKAPTFSIFSFTVFSNSFFVSFALLALGLGKFRGSMLTSFGPNSFRLKSSAACSDCLSASPKLTLIEGNTEASSSSFRVIEITPTTTFNI